MKKNRGLPANQSGDSWDIAVLYCRVNIIFAFLLSLGAVVLAASAHAEALRLSEPVEVTENYEVFGAPMHDKKPGIALSEVIARSDEFAGTTVRVSAEVKQVCQKKGCFFIASDGTAWARITFADYGFFIPTDSAGQSATLIGTFTRQQLSAQQAAHFAADLGEKAPQAAESTFEYAIVATSVQLSKR